MLALSRSSPSEPCYVFLASASWGLPLLTSPVSLTVYIIQCSYSVLISSCLLRKFQVEQTPSVGRKDPSTITSHNCCGHILIPSKVHYIPRSKSLGRIRGKNALAPVWPLPCRCQLQIWNQDLGSKGLEGRAKQRDPLLFFLPL